MQHIWTLFQERALYISLAHDAFVVDISWLDALLIVGALLLLKRLRR